MKKILWIATLLSLISLKSFSATVTGRVVDFCSKTPIAGALVSVNEYAQGETDANGKFRVISSSIKKGDGVTISVESLGYFKKVEDVLADISLPTDKATVDISSEISLTKAEVEIFEYRVTP